jgi:cell wall-associated NlpC family hydrolase
VQKILALAIVPVVVIVCAVVLVFGVAGDEAAACPAGQQPNVTIAGFTSLDAATMRNAGTVIGAGESMAVPRRGLIIEVMVTLQESHIHNLANSNVPSSLLLPNDGVGHDHDSVGVNQQRANWGSLAQRMDVSQSAQLFYSRLSRLPRWESMSTNDAAQTIQRSATPDAYGQWESLATQIVDSATPGGVGLACSAVLSSGVSGRAGIAIDNAMSKLGTPYQLGGSCLDARGSSPAGHCDCSSLVMTAWAAAGKNLPRTSELQYAATTRVLNASPTNLFVLAPGDLLFYNNGEDGIPGPGHVAMYIGGGKLIEAPKPGGVVSIRPVYSAGWLGAGRVT